MNKGGLLITGASCSSGIYFLSKLKEYMIYDEQKISVIVHRKESIDRVKEIHTNITVYCGDLKDSTFLDNVFSSNQFSTVFHIAGIFTSKEIVAASIKYRVNRVILVHTTGMFSKHKKEAAFFVETEEEVKSLLKEKGIDYTILRPTMIFGTKGDGTIERYVKMVAKSPIVPLINKGRSLVQPVYFKDLGEAYFKVLDRPDSTKNKEYNLSGERPLSMLELHQVIEHHLSLKRWNINVPLWMAILGAWLLYCCSFKAIDKRDTILRMDENRDFSHSEAYENFGYKPMSFSDALKESLVEQYY